MGDIKRPGADQKIVAWAEFMNDEAVQIMLKARTDVPDVSKADQLAAFGAMVRERTTHEKLAVLYTEVIYRLADREAGS